MTNATQYQFELLEVAELLLRKQKITEGLWTIGVNFGFAAVNMGPESEKVRPAAVVVIDRLALTRVEEMAPLTVDASKLSE
jgi:hypothetical protein